MRTTNDNVSLFMLNEGGIRLRLPHATYAVPSATTSPAARDYNSALAQISVKVKPLVGHAAGTLANALLSDLRPAADMGSEAGKLG